MRLLLICLLVLLSSCANKQDLRAKYESRVKSMNCLELESEKKFELAKIKGLNDRKGNEVTPADLLATVGTFGINILSNTTSKAGFDGRVEEIKRNLDFLKSISLEKGC